MPCIDNGMEWLCPGDGSDLDGFIRSSTGSAPSTSPSTLSAVSGLRELDKLDGKQERSSRFAVTPLKRTLFDELEGRAFLSSVTVAAAFLLSVTVAAVVAGDEDNDGDIDRDRDNDADADADGSDGGEWWWWWWWWRWFNRAYLESTIIVALQRSSICL